MAARTLGRCALVAGGSQDALNRCFIAFLICILLMPCTRVKADNAPNGPGAQDAFHWSPAAKQFLGTAANNTSLVYFTGAQGILTEVFYPSPDTPQNVDLQLIVEDAGGTLDSPLAEDKKQDAHAVNRVDPKAMLWEITTKANTGEWEIVKRIFADPLRNSVVQHTTFHVLKAGKTVSDYNVYVLNKPGIVTARTKEIRANVNNSRTLNSGKRTMLCASKPNSTSSALVTSLPWKTSEGKLMVSSGFAGINSGWNDLFGAQGQTPATHAMHFHFDGAFDGNVVQMGWLDFQNSTASQIEFDVVLSFGGNEAAAMAAADGTLDGNVAALQDQYVSEWKTYTSGLKPQTDDEYYLAAMTLKSSVDKSTGAIVAGLGTPWGDSSDAGDGYHEVWARDLFKFSSALLAAGDVSAAQNAVTFLFKRQMKGDGHFPRMSFVDGSQVDDNDQLDEAGMPIILAWRLNRVDLWPQVKLAADHILNAGPYTANERWEEQEGYSPSTIAAEIAGLVCAADLAAKNHDAASATKYLQAADAWHNNVVTWTFTRKGDLAGGTGRYFIRLNVDATTKTDDQNPDDAHTIPQRNDAPGNVDKKHMCDGGFLELVRFGVLSPNDWSIVESLSTYDRTLKQTIAGGDGFFRYNYDGYGDRDSGQAWNTGPGEHGRLWPLLTGERGVYEIERAGNGTAGAPYLKAMKAFASPEGFIPEQIFNKPVKFTNPDFEVKLPPGKKQGDSTGSMRPLSWAMGEYINLLVATQVGHGDAPDVVKARYVIASPVKVTFNVQTPNIGGQHVYILGDTVFLGSQDSARAVRLCSTGPTTWTQSVSLPPNISVTYKVFSQFGTGAPQFGQAKSLTTPSAGELTVNETLP